MFPMQIELYMDLYLHWFLVPVRFSPRRYAAWQWQFGALEGGQPASPTKLPNTYRCPVHCKPAMRKPALSPQHALMIVLEAFLEAFWMAALPS